MPHVRAGTLSPLYALNELRDPALAPGQAGSGSHPALLDALVAREQALLRAFAATKDACAASDAPSKA